MADYRTITSGGLKWRVGDRWVELFERGPFADLDALLAKSRVVKDLAVKRTYEVTVGARVFYVKRYKAGSWWNSLRRLMTGSRAGRELEVCLGVMKRGVPTVPLAAAASRGAESFVVIERLPGWTSLDALLAPGAKPGKPRSELLRSYGLWARAVHEAGVWQYDFNPSNVLVDPWGRDFRIIDFEKMKLLTRLTETSRLKLLAKLNRAPGVSPADLQKILLGYVEGRPEEERRMPSILERLKRYAAEYDGRRGGRLARSCVKENRNFARFSAGRHAGHRRKPYADRGVDGLSEEDVKRLAAGEWPGDLEKVEAAEAVDAWKAANAEAAEGGRTPLAVIVERGGRGGILVYRATRG